MLLAQAVYGQCQLATAPLRRFCSTSKPIKDPSAFWSRRWRWPSSGSAGQRSRAVHSLNLFEISLNLFDTDATVMPLMRSSNQMDRVATTKQVVVSIETDLN